MRFVVTAVVRCRNPESHAGLLCAVAKTSWRYLQVQGSQFERMMDTLKSTPIPRVDAAQGRQWLGGVKEFPDIELLMQIISQGCTGTRGGCRGPFGCLGVRKSQFVCPFFTARFGEDCQGCLAWQIIRVSHVRLRTRFRVLVYHR